MKHLIRISFHLFFISLSSFSYGQMTAYNYKREINNISDQWHKVILPNELFGKTSNDLSDIRIFGLTTTNDTIEAPYLLRLSKEKTTSQDVAFKILNVSHNANGYYFTFEIPTKESINQIKLDFIQKNFDWKVTLKGSQDNKEWFTLLKNFRILSIKNKQTDFQFTKLNFPSSKYRFVRVFIDSKEKPKLKVASIAKYNSTDGTFKKYSIKKLSTKENKQTKQTEIDIELPLPVRLSHINIGVSDTFDYYRHVTIKYLSDSLKTDRGWKYNFNTLIDGTLNSIEKNGFQFSSTTVQKLKIYIDNHDNQPLEINTVEVKGYIHELVARFSEPGSYFLTYGNKRAARANYDIERFRDNIPKTLTALNLNAEMTLEKEKIQGIEPLFKNKTWLWTIMTVIILLLGWFSIKMMNKKF